MLKFLKSTLLIGGTIMKEIFAKTTRYIYDLAAERIYQKKEMLNVSYYQIAGYKNEIDYRESAKKKYDPKMINNIAKGICGKRNSYLIPEQYVGLLTCKLNFSCEHELLWGTDEEISRYAPKLFELLMDDCLIEEINNKENFTCLLSNFGKETPEVNSEKIDKISRITLDDKNSVESQFIKDFTDFTNNSLKGIKEEEKEGVIQRNKVKNRVLVSKTKNYLDFKKLPESIEEFVEVVFSQLIALIFLKELIRSQQMDN
jgi:hypothetical protein